MRALETSFAGGVEEFVGGGSVCGGADVTDRGEFAELFVLTKGLAVAALAVGVDGEVFFKATGPVEKEQAADANCAHNPVAQDGEEH